MGLIYYLHSFVFHSNCRALDILFWLACCFIFCIFSFNIFVSLIIQILANNPGKIFYGFDWRWLHSYYVYCTHTHTHTHICVCVVFNKDRNSRIRSWKLCGAARNKAGVGVGVGVENRWKKSLPNTKFSILFFPKSFIVLSLALVILS